VYIAPDGSWSMASGVWDVDQRTTVHSHETWGVVGIYAGVEHEFRYLTPTATTAGMPLTQTGETRWHSGQVTVCCTTVGIHVYGGDIATIRRWSYDVATGEATPFVSGWDTPA